MAEVKDYIADVIFFQGCGRRCSFCYNPELQSFIGGEDMNAYDIIDRLSVLSSVVVLTGGEPILQGYELLHFIEYLHSIHKKVILETACISEEFFKACDKVYLSLKVFNDKVLHSGLMTMANMYDNVEPVIVIGHPGFDITVFRQIIMRLDGEIWIKFYNDLPCDTKDIYHMLKAYHKKWKVLDKLQL